jgi:hypothetical protein
VSKQCPASRTKRTRLPCASVEARIWVKARIFVVRPPLDLPIA